MDRSQFRIAIAGLASENNTFSTVNTGYEDFRVLRGEQAWARYPFLQGGMLASVADCQFLPAYHAKALPGGMIEAAAFARLIDELLASLKQVESYDALYLDLHGAMHVVGLPDAEAELLRRIRAAVGDECLIGASMDLHGNVSRELVEQINLCSAYRTAPHIDEEQTRERVCRLLLESLRQRWPLYRAWVPIPVLLPGERTSTQAEPAQSIYNELTWHDWQPGVLDASLWVGYVWEDEARAHATAVVTGLDPASVEQTAHRIAERYWRARHQFQFGVSHGTVDWCIDQAIQEPEGPVFISDSGDNPTAGGVGDLHIGVAALIANRSVSSGACRAIYASVWDADAVETCFAAGTQQTVQLTLAPPSMSGRGQPRLSFCGQVQFLSDSDEVAGRQAVVRVGGLELILTQHRKPFHYQHDFTALGLRFTDAKIVMVKIGYLVPDLEAAAAKTYLALTDGAVNQHVATLPYRRLNRPIYPLDHEFAWEPNVSVVPPNWPIRTVSRR